MMKLVKKYCNSLRLLMANSEKSFMIYQMNWNLDINQEDARRIRDYVFSKVKRLLKRQSNNLKLTKDKRKRRRRRNRRKRKVKIIKLIKQMTKLLKIIKEIFQSKINSRKQILEYQII